MSGIEPVGLAHAPAVAKVHDAAFPAREAWSLASIAEVLGMPGVFGFVDASGGTILARAVADEAEILTLAVVPATRRGGVGRALLAMAMAEAARRGARVMHLEVAAGNAAALALYAGAGFERVGVRRGYYPGGEDAVLLRRPLD